MTALPSGLSRRSTAAERGPGSTAALITPSRPMPSRTSTDPTPDLLRSGYVGPLHAAPAPVRPRRSPGTRARCPVIMAPGERGRLEQKRQLPAASGRRDLGRRPPHETRERPGQMGLIRVPDLTRHADRGHAPAQQPGGPLGPPDLPDGPAGQARGPRHSSFHRARGQTFNVPLQSRRRDRIMHQQTGPDQSVDEDIGVVRPRELPSEPIKPERRLRRPRQRQRAVDQLAQAAGPA